MTKKDCPLGEDCDLTIAWMSGAEDARDRAKARIEALEAKLAKNEALMQAGFAEYERRLAKAVEAAYREGFLAGTADGWVNNPRIKVEWKRSKALASLQGDKP